MAMLRVALTDEENRGMTRSLFSLTLLLFLSHFVFAQDKPARPTVDDLGWMSGCWKQDRGKGRYAIEQWTKPAGMILGTSRSYRDGKMTSYEFLRIIEKDGDIFFVAIPSGQKEAAFKLTSLNEGAAVFENPEHDFPQKIAYRKDGTDGLRARVEAKKDGKVGGFDVVFSRTSCEP
jgi:hypothetical protein